MVGRVEMETLRLPSRSTFQTDILWSQPFRSRFNVGSCPEPEINCYMGHYVQTMISDKPGVRQDEELDNWSHLNKGQFVVESPLAGFVPLQFCLCFFLKSRVYINHQRTLQGQHPCRNIPAAMSWLTLEMGLFTYSVYRTCI
jgi:hypothetical protein